MSQEEMVEVKLRLPKAVMDLLQAVEKEPEEYLEYSIVNVVRADLDAGVLADPKALSDKYGVHLD